LRTHVVNGWEMMVNGLFKKYYWTNVKVFSFPEKLDYMTTWLYNFIITLARHSLYSENVVKNDMNLL
jgi:hypothetical protein